MRITEIGIVKNNFETENNPHEIKKYESRIIIKDEFLEGLDLIEEYEFIDIVFDFDRSTSYEMTATTLRGNVKGLFATRKPDRPSSIAVTTVKLLERNGNLLRVIGLDALNNTPVLDIKPVDFSMVEDKMDKIRLDELKNNPRREIVNDILRNDLETLMIKAAALHGHYCPGVALGVMAGTKAMGLMRETGDGMEDILAITETNNCFSDGVQFVTGCSFGNNALIFKDFGKTAFTLTKRDGKGIRITARADAKEYMRQAHPLFTESFQKVVKGQDHSKYELLKFKKYGRDRAFATLGLDFDKLFKIENIKVSIPAYAPSHESIICRKCGENTMSTRAIGDLCLPCSGEKYAELNGAGIVMSDEL
ncbi:MAG: SAM-dependent methyltransferase [Bacteroidetes bacterium]|nr:SAM-dependent methyltransferase [Bacteroidota bacterium]